jgi:L-arabinose isomerase
MPRLPVGHAIWRPRPDFRVAVESWLTAGGAHHTVMSTQLGVAVFVAFASMCGVEIVVIDEGTTAEGVRRGLRADAAYYRG